MNVAEAIYLLCATTSLIAGAMLLRMYLLRRSPMLLWSFVGFLGLALNNVLVYLDLVVFQAGPDLSLPRAVAGATGMLVMLFGLIWEAQ
jgi:hypothetical protein